MTEKNDLRSLLHYRGAIDLGDKVLTSQLPTHLAACLRDAGAWGAVVQGDRVVFTGSGMGPVFSLRWPALAPFGCGQLQVDPASRQLRYSLRLGHRIALGFAVVGAMAAFGFATGMPKFMMIVFLPIAWMWIVCAPVWIGSRVFRRFLHHAISQAPRVPHEPAPNPPSDDTPRTAHRS